LDPVLRICFVCLGNIVRSPLAENMFIDKVDQTNLDGKYEVDSAGISEWHVGEPPDFRMRRVAAKHGLLYDGRARQFQARDLDYFDLIIAMDNENREDLLSLARTPEQAKKIYTLRAFDPLGGPDFAIPDPYYGGSDGFEEVYKIVDRSIDGLLQWLGVQS